MGFFGSEVERLIKQLIGDINERNKKIYDRFDNIEAELNRINYCMEVETT